MTKHTLTYRGFDITVTANTETSEHELTVKNAQSLDKVLKWVHKRIPEFTSIVMVIAREAK